MVPIGPCESPSQPASRSVQPFWQGSRTCPTDRQTYRPRYCECSNRPLSLDVMRPKNRVKLHESDSLPLDPTQHSKLLIRVEPVPTLTWTQTSTGRRSFAVSGPRTRNRLPATLQFTVCCVNWRVKVAPVPALPAALSFAPGLKG